MSSRSERYQATLIIQHAIDHVLRTGHVDGRFTDDATTDAYYILDRAMNRVTGTHV